MPFKLSIIEDFSSIFRGTKKLGDAFEDVADSLDDVAREGDRSGEKLERSFEDAFREVRRESKRMADDVADSTRESVTGRGGEAIQEFKDEARQNFSEVASSFAGDMDSAADLVQGTLGGLASSLPGWAGAVTGIMAMVGGALYASFSENAEAVEQRTQDMFDNMLASGVDFVDRQFVLDELAKIYSRADDASVAWGDLLEIVEQTGLEQATVARAFAGDASAGIELTNALAERQRALREEWQRAAGERRPGVYAPMPEDLAAVDRLARLWGQNEDAVDDARRRVQGYREAVEAVPTSIDLEVDANVQLAERELERFQRARRTATVEVTGDTRQLGRAIDSELSKVRVVRVGVQARPGTQVVI